MTMSFCIAESEIKVIHTYILRESYISVVYTHFHIHAFREVKCGHVTRWTNLLMTTCCDTLLYLNYSLYNFEINLPKREQQMLNACFEPVVIVFCCVIIRTTSNACDVFADTRPSPPRPLSSDSGRLNSVV